MEDKAEKQHNNKFDWLKAYQWQKGQSGNPKGRPKTKTLKEFARDFLASMDDETRIEYLKTVDPKIVWEMAEGRARQETDVTSAGRPIVVLASEIMEKNGITPEEDHAKEL